MIPMRRAPFPSLVVLIRAFFKAVVIVATFNLICAAAGFDPIQAVVRFNLWFTVGHGRERLIYAGDFANGQLPIPALLATHQIAYRAKATDEYRVIVLGDSAVMGWGLQDAETFSAQLTARNLQHDGRRVVAYNLAYPTASIARDNLVIEAALQYQPDAVIWFVTATGFANLPHDDLTRAVLNINRDDLRVLTTREGLTAWYAQWVLPESAYRNWIAFKDPSLSGVWLGTLFYPYSTPDVGGAARRMRFAPVPPVAKYTLDHPAFQEMPGQTWQFLQIAKKTLDAHHIDLLIVNEPTLIGTGEHSDVNYNQLYQRALYDRYRSVLQAQVDSYGLHYLDLWDTIPAPNFTDTVLHMDAEGYARVVDQVAPLFGQ